MATTEDDFAQTWKDAVNADQAPADKAAFNTKPLRIDPATEVAAPLSPAEEYAQAWSGEQAGKYGGIGSYIAPAPAVPADEVAQTAADAAPVTPEIPTDRLLTSEEYAEASGLPGSGSLNHWDSVGAGDRSYSEYANAWSQDNPDPFGQIARNRAKEEAFDARIAAGVARANAATKPAASGVASQISSMASGSPAQVGSSSVADAAAAGLGAAGSSSMTPASQLVQTKPLQSPAPRRPAAVSTDDRFA